MSGIERAGAEASRAGSAAAVTAAGAGRAEAPHDKAGRRPGQACWSGFMRVAVRTGNGRRGVHDPAGWRRLRAGWRRGAAAAGSPGGAASRSMAARVACIVVTRSGSRAARLLRSPGSELS